MPQSQSRRKRWATATRWPVGVALAYLRYFWSTTPIHRWEMQGSWPEDAPPALPGGVDASELQGIEDGAGRLFHRIYRTRVVGSSVRPDELMRRMRVDLDRVAPSEFATFQQLGRESEGVATGDEYVVRMPGPWDGPVRTVAVDATSFRLATLPDHLEAGQIEFRARADYRSLWLEIESWARSSSRFSDLLYDRLSISKEVQMHMWSSVLRRMLNLTEGRMEGGIVVTTRIVAERALPGSRHGGELDPRRRARLRGLADRRPNFDFAALAEPREEEGWQCDDMVVPLPPEPSGVPVAPGSWQVARDLMDSYQLADPGVVTSTHDEAAPLPGRDMLLRISFRGLVLWSGVRIGESYEETRDVEGQQVRVFGWSYDTLEGHFEEGRMHYELWKWLDSGMVEFRLRAVSRPARNGPLLPRLGFRLVGRSHQLRFYRQICRRVRRLTEAQLETERAARWREPNRKPPTR